MMVTVDPDETNAYVSVLSATGSFEMPGASRCDDTARLPARPQQRGHERLVLEHDRPLADEHLELAGRGIAKVDDEWLARQGQLRLGQRRGGGVGTADDGG